MSGVTDQQRVLSVFEPIAARLLAADAAALTELRPLVGLAGCDGHPRDTAMAWVRRAHVATELARIARATPGWRDYGVTRQQGCYEFTVGENLAVRLATDVDATPGPPATGSLFALGNLSRHNLDRVLIRLRGVALSAPIMDVAALTAVNTVEWQIPMAQIAMRSTSIVPTPQPAAPPKPKVTLPARRASAGVTDAAGA